VLVDDHDLILQHVYDISVVPDTFGGQHRPADFHRVQAVVAQAILAHQGAVVVVVLRVGLGQARAAPVVRDDAGVEGVGVDVKRRGGVVADRVADDHRLRAADEDRCLLVAQPAIAVHVHRLLTCRVVAHGAARQPEFGLLHLDRIEAGKASLHGNLAAAIGDQCPVNAASRQGVEDQAAPVAGGGRGIRRVPVSVGVKRAAESIAVVGDRRENHRISLSAFGDQVRRSALGLDPRFAQFDHDAWVDRQTATQPGL